jgi:hypothetical protein
MEVEMISLKTGYRSNLVVNIKADHRVLNLFRTSPFYKRAKIYAVDYTGHDFIQTPKGEIVRNSLSSALRTA